MSKESAVQFEEAIRNLVHYQVAEGDLTIIEAVGVLEVIKYALLLQLEAEE